MNRHTLQFDTRLVSGVNILECDKKGGIMDMEVTIKVENLTKYYHNLKAVENINITVCRGEVFGLLGANGAGKSTSLECILGTKKMDCGEVFILGKNPVKDRTDVFEKTGVQFQEAKYQELIKVSELCENTACVYKNPHDYKELLSDFGIAD